MANITSLSAAAYGKDVIDKLNEIIDWLNGTTDGNRVSNITVSGTTLTVTHINGSKDTHTLQDTTYTPVTSSKNGLVEAGMIITLNSLVKQVSILNVACHAIEEKREAIAAAQNNDPGYDSGGGDGNDGGDGDDGDDGGHGGGGGDF